MAECSCGGDNVEVTGVVLRDDVPTALRVPVFGGEAAGVLRGSASVADVLVVVGGESSSTVVCVSGIDVFSEDVVASDSFDEAIVSLSVAEESAESAALVEADEVALESVGSANATTGVVAAAHPTPSATANAPTRPTHLT